MRRDPAPDRPAANVKIFTFVVHVWRERVGSNRYVWRGSLTDARSDGKTYFQSLPGLLDAIARLLKTGPPEK